MNLWFRLIVFSLIPLSLLQAQNRDSSSTASTNPPYLNNSISNALKKVGKFIKRQGITKLPPIRTTLKEFKNRSDIVDNTRNFSSRDISGTPPTLASLGSLSTIKEIFWRPGVVDAIAAATPDQNQCSEFYSGGTDGSSGGIDACYMAQNVGISFQDLLNSETTLCYLKAFPTKTNFLSGGVSIIKGRLPDNDITKVFAPGSKARLVQVSFNDDIDAPTADKIFIRVSSNSENKKLNLLNRTQVYFCQNGEDHPDGYDTVDVLTTGEVSLTLVSDANLEFNTGPYNLNVTGHLLPEGSKLGWDLSKSRTATLNSFTSSALTDGFKTTFDITSDNLIYTKTLNSFEGSDFKSYSITSFTGEKISDVSFIEGGFKNIHIFENEPFIVASATEYRDTYYAAAPNSALAALVTAYDIDSDIYYSTPINVDINLTQFNCNAKPNIVLKLDTSVPSLVRSLAPCEQEYLMNMDFCFRDTTVQQAQDNYFNACTF